MTNPIHAACPICDGDLDIHCKNEGCDCYICKDCRSFGTKDFKRWRPSDKVLLERQVNDRRGK